MVAHHTILSQVMLRIHYRGNSPIITMPVYTKPWLNSRANIRLRRSVLHDFNKDVATV
jgi:hypothetical protein